MKPFIRKEHFNYINKKLKELQTSYKFSSDMDIIKVTQSMLNESMVELISTDNPEELEVLSLESIKEHDDVIRKIEELSLYVTGMEKPSSATLKKLFKKEKKLRLPKETDTDTDIVYYRWIDETAKKLYIVYDDNGTLKSMVCRLPKEETKGTHVCKLCHFPGNNNEVTFVSPVCKPDKSGNYRSIGFSICSDGERCNNHITSTENLVKILDNVNGKK